jgi:hypothetical protein
MSGYTDIFYALVRGVLRRRKAFLLNSQPKEYIYPPRGQLWDASAKAESMCDAFILLVVSELEEYFEGVLRLAIQSYEDIYGSHVIKNCRASSEFIELIRKKKAELEKNNNANWSRISHFFEFVGMKKEVHFPQDFWDDIESVVKHRGDLAHNGTSMSIAEDRRNVIHKIELTMARLRIFDRQLYVWLNKIDEERDRLASINLSFAPTY